MASLRGRALNEARTYVGVRENPPYSNSGPHINDWLQAAGIPLGLPASSKPWCCAFVSAMLEGAGLRRNLGASVGNLLAYAKEQGWVVVRPLRGDLACFEFGEGAWAYDDHIGFVERVLALRWSDGRFTGWVQTIEGNTSMQSDPSGSQSDGGGVYRRRRWLRGIAATFVRVPGK